MQFVSLPTALIYFSQTALDRNWSLFGMFTEAQRISALIEMHFHLLLNLVRLELRWASESIQPAGIN